MMGNKTGFKGVEIHGEKIRIAFMFEGKRCRETLHDVTKLTPTYFKYAAQLRAQIIDRIKFGTFRYVDYFPNSERAGWKQHSRVEKFKEWSEAWLAGKPGIETATRKAYGSAIRFWNKAIGDKFLSDILPLDIENAMTASTAPKCAKTLNNYLSVLRLAFDSARVNRKLTVSPADDVKNLSYQAPEPDPFSQAEMESVLAYMREHFDERVWNYFTFAFMTGLRPSELIALRWSDVDFERATVTVQRAKVASKMKGTKTNLVRAVRLHADALDALKRQKKYTFMSGDLIFQNPVTGRAWADDKQQRIKYWDPALKALGFKGRDAYQTRHTYATILLSNGVFPSFIQRQLGHTTVKTTLERYARFLPEALENEMEKANKLFAPKTPQKETVAC
jgi:integrase